MRIENLRIQNFRGIAQVDLESLGDMVIIAGQNGSGKSCIFDAIRLLKSVYGGYQANEWQQWMGEFQVNLGDRSSGFTTMFNDPSKELRIECDFHVSEEERKFIGTNADELLREKIWRTIMPEAYAWGGLMLGRFAAQFRDREPEVAARASAEYAPLMKELASSTIRGKFSILPNKTPFIENSIALSIIFSTFRPSEIGVIDYHGAQRHYGRENVQGINLNLEAVEQQRSASALYNGASKYNNVKSEMASAFIKERLAEHAGVAPTERKSLTNTLKELFQTFFPEKTFKGPTATVEGALTFPVTTTKGTTHDLDDLSAGEKEILYGYLRIRNSAPRYSIILLDEPELHLNPRLIRGLPQFYRKNLGEALQNQIWLVTHSDALLREVVGRAAYNVFHMLPCGSISKGENQLRPLSATTDLDLALADLVGDLASYRPGGKVVVLEGGGDSDFDQRVVSTLFPNLQEQANLIPGTNKVRVRALLEILDAARNKGFVPIKFFCVTDKDAESPATQSTVVNSFSWDVYHIENYFLVPKYIQRVLKALQLSTSLNEDGIWDALRECAKETLPQLVRHELAEYANSRLVRAIDTGTDPKADDVASALSAAVKRSASRTSDLLNSDLAEEQLLLREQELRTKFTASIADGTWIAKFRGRNVLKRFVGRYAPSVTYEVFRNLILAQMKDDGFQPIGMKNIIDQILVA